MIFDSPSFLNFKKRDHSFLTHTELQFSRLSATSTITFAEFKAEYERTRPEFEIMRALVDARISQHMTQKELAEKSGVRQSNISRIENGTCSPTIATLEALANGMGKKLIVSFE